MIIIETVQKAANGHAKSRVNHVRSDFMQRNQHETPLVKGRMGNDQTRSPDDLLPVKQKIQIDDPRSPWRFPSPAHRPLYRQQGLKQLARRQNGSDLGHAIDKPALLAGSYRFRPVER